jgi:hypothetical protein
MAIFAARLLIFAVIIVLMLRLLTEPDANTITPAPMELISTVLKVSASKLRSFA